MQQKRFLQCNKPRLKRALNYSQQALFVIFHVNNLFGMKNLPVLRPVLDTHSQPLDISQLSEGELCEAILHWSALPGASRHHWGTEIDVYDPLRIPTGQTLQLEPWEYEAGGYLAELNDWLTENMSTFDFYRPFTAIDAGVAYEPWHISYWYFSA